MYTKATYLALDLKETLTHYHVVEFEDNDINGLTVYLDDSYDIYGLDVFIAGDTIELWYLGNKEKTVDNATTVFKEIRVFLVSLDATIEEAVSQAL